MSRQAVASELQALIEQMQQMCERGERLASSSGGLVNPTWFRGASSAMVGAAGDLDQKGLLVQPVQAEEPKA